MSKRIRAGQEAEIARREKERQMVVERGMDSVDELQKKLVTMGRELQRAESIE